MAIPVIGRVMGEAARAALAKQSGPRRSRFKASPKAAWDLLQREMRLIGAVSAVLELDAPARTCSRCGTRRSGFCGWR